MSDLIKRIEEAEGPCRELDAEITKAANVSLSPCFCTGACDPKHSCYKGACVTVPAYTSSIDAAVTLVPEECFPSISQNVRSGIWRAWVAVSTFDKWNKVKYISKDAVEAKTPALAITIAALKARGLG